MTLPSASEAIAAGRLDDLKEVAAALGRTLPPLHRVAGEEGVDRIVYLMPRTGAGGGARVLFEHANHLHRLGASVTVVSHFPRPQWFGLEADFVEVPFGQPLCTAIPPCDVIVAGYWDEILPARLLGIAPVVHFEQGDFHLYDEVTEDLRPLVEASLGAADWTITVGQAAESALLERYGIVAHRIVNAVDAKVFYAQPKPPSTRSVLFVGWDGAAFKGIDIARQVAEGLRSSHPEVAAVWITPQAPNGSVIGTTVVAPSQQELGRHMREATVYVGTSRYESFPLPPLEAMASGTPVVSTANGGILAYGNDGANCLLVPIDDVEALLDATRRVLNDGALAEKLAAEGLRTAHRFEWPVVTAELLTNLRRLLDTLPATPTVAADIQLADLVFEDDRNRRCLLELVGASPYEHFAIPVSRPIYKGYRLVRWSVVATKPGGIPGVGRAYLPARSEEIIEDSTYQFGVDLLREECADDAFAWFVGQCQQSPEASEASLGRWVLLSLIEAGRASDAMDLATLSIAAHSSHPDYYFLAALAALEAHRSVDAAAALEAISVLKAGAHFEEWFDRPGDLLVEQAGR